VSNRGPGDCPVGANVQLPTENYRTAAEVCRFGIAKSSSEESYVSRNEVSVPSYRRLLFGQATNKERSNIARRCRPRPHPRNRRAARVALGTADDPSGVPSGTSGGQVVCLSVCPRAYLRNHMTTLHQFSMLVASGSVLFCHRSRCVVAQHLSIVVYVVTRFGEHKSVLCRNGWTDRAGF